jgi:uncharacterized protein (DUF2164 family)
MSIELDRDVEERLIASIKRYFDEELETEIGELKAKLLLRFVLKEIGPIAYNQGVSDVRRHLRNVVDEIDGVCFEPEFGFWKG